MPEILKLSPKFEVSRLQTANSSKVQNGDGYEQRSFQGVIPYEEEWQIGAVLTKVEYTNLSAFLRKHAGIESFHWSPTGVPTTNKYLCFQWVGVKLGPDIHSFSAVFRRAFE